MATILKRQHKHKTTYYVAYRLEGKLVRKKVGKSKVLAERLKGDIEAKIEKQEIGFLPKDCLINDFFKEYFNRIKNDVGALYLKRLEIVKANLIRFLNECHTPESKQTGAISAVEVSEHCLIKKLSQLTPNVWSDYKNYRLSKPIAGKKSIIRKRTLNLELSVFKTMFTRAVRWGLITASNLIYIDYLKEDDSVKVRPLTSEEVRAVLDNCPKWFYPIVYTTLHTGMRASEIRFLEWNDIDLKEGRISLRLKENWHPKSTGKKIRERSIPISKELVEYLKTLKGQSVDPKDNFVFHNSEGQQLTPTFQSAFQKITKKAGIKDVKQFHALRHTYATHLGKSGVDIVTMQSVLGHADVKTTMRYATTPLEDHMKKEIEKLKY